MFIFNKNEEIVKMERPPAGAGGSLECDLPRTGMHYHPNERMDAAKFIAVAVSSFSLLLQQLSIYVIDLSRGFFYTHGVETL